MSFILGVSDAALTGRKPADPRALGATTGAGLGDALLDLSLCRFACSGVVFTSKCCSQSSWLTLDLITGGGGGAREAAAAACQSV